MSKKQFTGNMIVYISHYTGSKGEKKLDGSILKHPFDDPDSEINTLEIIESPDLTNNVQYWDVKQPDKEGVYNLHVRVDYRYYPPTLSEPPDEDITITVLQCDKIEVKFPEVKHDYV